MYPMGDNAELDALMEQHASLPGPMRPYLLDGIAAAKSNRCVFLAARVSYC